jgi:hypothetical protein
VRGNGSRRVIRNAGDQADGALDAEARMRRRAVISTLRFGVYSDLAAVDQQAGASAIFAEGAALFRPTLTAF